MADALSLQDWLNRLTPGETPIFRHTRDALIALRTRSEDITARELASVVLADPLATLRLIFAANNRTNLHFGSDVATVEHALMMQGLGTYLDRVVHCGVVEETPVGRRPEALHSLYRLLRIAQHAAWQARDFAVLHTDIRSEEVHVAVLLYYAPEFLIWLQAPEIAEHLARLRRKLSSDDAEQKALGFPLIPLKLAMLEAWRIPDITRDLLNKDYIARPRQAIVQACFEIAHHSRHGWWDEHLDAAYEALGRIENTPLDVIVATVHANAIRAARFGDWIPATPAAAWLPMQAGPWPPEPGDAEEEEAPAEPAASVCPMPDHDVFRDALQGIEQHLDGSLSLPQMSAHILRGLHTGLGLSRILFAMVTPDGKRVKSRFTLGVPQEDPLRHFEFTLGTKDLFGQLMGKMQGIWLNEGNREKLWPMVSPKLREVIGTSDFYAMSLYAGSRPIGLIYADRGHGACNLDTHTYTDFKMFCLQAARGLGKIKQ